MTDEEKPKNRKCLHIEISTHPYKKDGWEMEIGHLTGRIGISTPEPDKKQILDEIARAMDGLKSEEHRLGGLQLHKKGGKQMKDCIGIELNEKYVEYAKKRINDGGRLE